MSSRPTYRPSARSSQSEDRRKSILQAAIAEFAELGAAGARMDAIARAAGVNKALLHYYYGTKEALYAAVLDEVLTGQLAQHLAVLQGAGSPGERLLRYFLAHFNYLAEYGVFARLVEYEMMRAKAKQPSHIAHLVKTCFGPLGAAIRAVITEGMQSGELRSVDPAQVTLTLTGMNVYYFVSTPVFREITGKDPRDPGMLSRRRSAMLDFAAAALFTDREQGLALARNIQSNPIA
jgi:TetR/AcrR family transcriptional regulator